MPISEWRPSGWEGRELTSATASVPDLRSGEPFPNYAKTHTARSEGETGPASSKTALLSSLFVWPGMPGAPSPQRTPPVPRLSPPSSTPQLLGKGKSNTFTLRLQAEGVLSQRWLGPSVKVRFVRRKDNTPAAASSSGGAAECHCDRRSRHASSIVLSRISRSCLFKVSSRRPQVRRPQSLFRSRCHSRGPPHGGSAGPE